MSQDANFGEAEAAGEPLSENTVEYMLFVIDSQQSDPRRARARLDAIRKAAVELAQSLTKDYIWQREAFEISLKSEHGLLFLQGTTDYGDAIEDEWLIVYLLCELSKAHSDLWVRVSDSDGEFLLVEAANVLPSWLSPEIDRYRVWIHLGKIFLIPFNPNSQTEPEHLSVLQAVTFLRSKPDALIHLPALDAEAFDRLRKYPEQIANSIHHSLVTIPRTVAYILHALPKIIAPAVEHFYLRDANSLKPILSSTAPLRFPPEDLVTVSVRFSKTLYAQLKSQRFDAPPRWQPLLRKHQELDLLSKEDQKKLERLEMGMKLTCGFEMLAANAEKSKSRVAREMAILLDDLEEDGSSALPSDEEIKQWENVDRDDDDSWLDINYEDFERELEGKQAASSSKAPSGFGEAQTQENLRKIVSRFEAFLNDDSAGLEGAELDRMDIDDDDEDDDDDDEDQDDEVNFDEEAFSNMMKEMMGITKTGNAEGEKARKVDTAEESMDSEAEEDRDIQELASRMEAELKEYGTLQLDPPITDRAIRSKESLEKGKGKQPAVQKESGQQANTAEDDDDDEEIDIDFNLAKNLLESFKSQGGMAGPAGNLMGLMGFQLPRDEDDEDEASKD
ncbi:SGT1-domain-containing protein [Trichoderma citrinoviride]|uniref:SGT1-domain-containing protein n=1 Tax=Trichoderma citrinoviride TaxID=58853 RepID=A0A2T4AZI0_9HYPO|nr:SGT1-domain-containing protein [Trichoderma citrinoviride]PTB62472.1 SGT1-domain-containing protein [Trichoderma citrinoviride]